MRKVILALSLACLFASTNDASAFGFRKKKAACCPTAVTAPVVSYAAPAPACGCDGALGSSFAPSTGSYAPGYSQPYGSSMGMYGSGGYGMYPRFR